MSAVKRLKTVLNWVFVAFLSALMLLGMVAFALLAFMLQDGMSVTDF